MNCLYLIALLCCCGNGFGRSGGCGCRNNREGSTSCRNDGNRNDRNRDGGCGSRRDGGCGCARESACEREVRREAACAREARREAACEREARREAECARDAAERETARCIRREEAAAENRSGCGCQNRMTDNRQDMRMYPPVYTDGRTCGCDH